MKPGLTIRRFYSICRDESVREAFSRGLTHSVRQSQRKYDHLKCELRRRAGRIPDQRRLVHELLERDEFALIVLDACRFDYFEEEYEGYLEGDLSRAWSPASRTRDWAPEMWSGDFDLTYVSSNPYIGDFRNKKDDDTSYRGSDHISNIVETWKTKWDSKLGTVPGEAVTEDALAAAGRSDDTRLVVHYMQPHAPFIGETFLWKWQMEIPDGFESVSAESSLSEEERDALLEERSIVTPEENIKYNISSGERKEYDISVEGDFAPESLISEGVITHEELRTAYRDNLRYVLGEVRRLVRRLDVPTVVTADHGELLGESGLYRHPDEFHPILREVPWLTVDESMVGQERTEPVPRESPDVDVTEGEVRDRLAQLGYIE
jgi:hypothetical protein